MHIAHLVMQWSAKMLGVQPDSVKLALLTAFTSAAGMDTIRGQLGQTHSEHSCALLSKACLGQARYAALPQCALPQCAPDAADR